MKNNQPLKLSDLKGIGLKSERWLNDVGIFTKEDLESVGPVRAFIRLQENGDIKPSLNLLYALIGALEDERWIHIAQQDKARLLMELEGFRELKETFEQDGLKINV